MAFGSVNVGSDQDGSVAYVSIDQLGKAGGVATLDGNGQLTESQRWKIDGYTQSQTDERIADSVSTHNRSEQAHPDMRGNLAKLETAVQALELKLGTSIKDNPFQVTFASLDGVDVVGIWNALQARIEF